MPTYPVINLKTKEKKEISMTMLEYEEWRKDNPDWDKDWNAGVAACQEVGDFRDKMKVLVLVGPSLRKRISKNNTQRKNENFSFTKSGFRIETLTLRLSLAGSIT